MAEHWSPPITTAGPPPDPDPAVHHPAHYNEEGGVECIDVMRLISSKEGFVEHCRLTAFKYLWRAGKKGALAQDLEKAAVYARWAADRAKE